MRGRGRSSRGKQRIRNYGRTIQEREEIPRDADGGTGNEVISLAHEQVLVIGLIVSPQCTGYGLEEGLQLLRRCFLGSIWIEWVFRSQRTERIAQWSRTWHPVEGQSFR